MGRDWDLIDRRTWQEYDARHIFDSVFKRFFFSKFFKIFRKNEYDGLVVECEVLFRLDVILERILGMIPLRVI